MASFGSIYSLIDLLSVEGGETAIKLARRWGYDVNGIPKKKSRYRLQEIIVSKFKVTTQLCFTMQIWLGL